MKNPEDYLPPSLIDVLKYKDITEIKEFSSIYAKDIVEKVKRSIIYYKKGITVRNLDNAELYRIEFFSHSKAAHKICLSKAKELNNLSAANLKNIVCQAIGKQASISEWF